MTENELNIELEKAKKRISDLEISIEKYERIVQFYSKMEDDYKSMFESIQAGIVIHNDTGMIVYSNKIANDILTKNGTSLEGISGFDEIWQFVDADLNILPNHLAPANISLETGKPQSNVILGVTGNVKDDIKWLVVNTHPVLNQAINKVEKVYVTFNEITKAYQMELEKHEIENKLSIVFNNSLVPMAIVSDLEIEFVNKAFWQLFGYSHFSEAIGKNILEFFEHSNHIMLLENYKQRMLGHNPESNFQLNGLKRNHSTFEAELNISAFKFGDLNKTIFSIIDVTKKNIHLKNLIESELRFRNMLENLPLGVVYSKDNKLFINKTCESIIGYCNDEVDTFEKWLTQIYGENKYNYIFYYEKFDNIELPNSFIIPIFDKHGNERSVEFVIYNSDLSQIWILNDITEKLNLDNILKNSETKYRLLFENMMSAFALHEIIVDENNLPINYKFLEINLAFEQQTGLKRADIINKNVSDVIPNIEKFWFELYGNVALTGKSIKFEQYSTPLDKYFNIYCYSPQKYQFATIFNDITTKKKAELELLSSEEKYRTLVENAFDAIYILKGKRYEFVNQRYCDLLEYTFEELTSPTFSVDILLNDNSRKVVYDRYEKRKNNLPIDNQYEIEVITKFGKVIVIEVSTVAIGSQTDDITVMGIVRDITSRKHIELQLIKSKEEAELLNKLKTNFISNLSHELRTPLNGILGFSKILSVDILDEELAFMCNLIYENGKRLLTTINQLLDLSKIEGRKLDLVISKFNVYDCIANQLELTKVIAKSKSIKIIFKKPDEEIFANLDETFFATIISNIVGNAVKFTNFGEVNISLSEITQKDTKKLIIEIEDTGIGIPENRLNIIFDEFRQVSEGLNRNFEGTGIGLTIAKNYTELMNGSIEASSKLMVGTKFKITLPISINKEEFDYSIVEIVGKNQKIDIIKTDDLPKILYLEDDFSSLLVVRDYLRGISQVDFCRTGQEALSLAESMDYDLFLLDINLGKGMSGNDVVDRLRQSKKNYLKPIIAVTAYSVKYEFDNLIDHGFSNIITKPFEKIYFVDVIKNILGIK